eukprot:7396081-Lingulodinium_polyedra.AAC.1
MGSLGTTGRGGGGRLREDRPRAPPSAWRMDAPGVHRDGRQHAMVPSRSSVRGHLGPAAQAGLPLGRRHA